ncbi:hypothetical protein APHAL10511_005974 [Amanita phalloides]|nr:hypothetical protein APHAL10511_005974 [Amanita phalloides]
MAHPSDSSDAEHQAMRDDALALYSQSIREFTMRLYALSLRPAEENIPADSTANTAPDERSAEKVNTNLGDK